MICVFALDTATGRDSQTGSVASMLIVVVIVYDWRTRGRPRRADAYGCPHILTNMVDYQMNS